MESIKIPSKYKRLGLKVKCLHCKWQLGDGKCHGDKSKIKGIGSCNHKDKHRLNAVVCVPGSGGARKTKILDARTIDGAIEEMNQFREQLRIGNYQNIDEVEISKPTYLNYAADYLDCLNGVNTPEHLVRLRSKGHIRDNKRALTIFGEILQKHGCNLELLQLKDIKDRHVELFYQYLIYELKLGNTTKNKYMVMMKTFFNWCIEMKDFTGKNLFAKSELVFERQDKEIVSKTEFEKLLSVITLENGISYKHDENRNYYRPWLINAYRLALEIGERSEPIVTLKWSDIIEFENGAEIFKITNLKANRIKTGKDKGKYIRYIPITKSLKKLLIEFGYNEKKGSDSYVLETEKGQSVPYIMQLITRSFSHYVSKAELRHIVFKDLRKTYISHLTMVMGEKSVIFTGHGDEKVLKDHYLSSAFLAANLNDFSVF